MRSVIAGLLDEWAPKGAFDFEEFAAQFPIAVMCRLIGASPRPVPEIRSSLETFGLSFSLDRALLPDLENATRLLDTFVQNLVADRQRHRKPGAEKDHLEILLETLDSGRLSERGSAVCFRR